MSCSSNEPTKQPADKDRQHNSPGVEVEQYATNKNGKDHSWNVHERPLLLISGPPITPVFCRSSKMITNRVGRFRPVRTMRVLDTVDQRKLVATGESF